jgi:hypothetical protein
LYTYFHPRLGADEVMEACRAYSWGRWWLTLCEHLSSWMLYHESRSPPILSPWQGWHLTWWRF